MLVMLIIANEMQMHDKSENYYDIDTIYFFDKLSLFGCLAALLYPLIFHVGRKFYFWLPCSPISPWIKRKRCKTGGQTDR